MLTASPKIKIYFLVKYRKTLQELLHFCHPQHNKVEVTYSKPYSKEYLFLLAFSNPIKPQKTICLRVFSEIAVLKISINSKKSIGSKALFLLNVSVRDPLLTTTDFKKLRITQDA